MGSINQIASASDVLFSCLPNNSVIREVYLGENGVVSAIKPGSTTIDCPTVGPDATRDVYEAMSARGASHLDASMLGSVKQATEGTISFVVGGDAEAFERARPVLEVCGQMIRHCGPSGAGNHMKLIHQTLVAGHAVAVAEAMGLCLETGADIETFYDIVTQGTGFAYSRYFENRVPRMRDGDFSPLFMLKFMLKDARLARDMAEEAEQKFPAMAAVIRTLEESDERGWGDDDFSAAMKTVEARTGRKIKG
jgi:3-hydroxyisobutyrate dehydrogenase-like beta-hydroxyacid dehydrogenase